MNLGRLVGPPVSSQVAMGDWAGAVTVCKTVGSRLLTIDGLAITVVQLFKRLTLDGVPLPDENMAIIIDVHLCMPGQAVLTAMNLIRLAVLVEGRQVYAPDGSRVSDAAAMIVRLHDTESSDEYPPRVKACGSYRNRAGSQRGS